MFNSGVRTRAFILGLTSFTWHLPAAAVQSKPVEIAFARYAGSPQQDPADAAMKDAARDQAKRANQERQASLKRDTETLLKLATELKANVDRTTEYTLSLDVIKKADQIEKLAKNVKEKMKASSLQPEIGAPPDGFGVRR